MQIPVGRVARRPSVATLSSRLQREQESLEPDRPADALGVATTARDLLLRAEPGAARLDVDAPSLAQRLEVGGVICDAAPRAAARSEPTRSAHMVGCTVTTGDRSQARFAST